jgi:hypothetical protein
MEMLLMGIVLSLLGVVVSAGLFAAATRGADAKMAADALEPVTAPEPTLFFASPAAHPALARPPVSVDVLLLRIERHVRMEQAAAESFMARPTVEMLHMPTASPLVH